MKERERTKESRKIGKNVQTLDIHYAYTKSCLFIHSLQLYLEYILYSYMMYLAKEREREGEREREESESE